MKSAVNKIPKYRSAGRAIASDIEKGKLQPGEKLPSERELGEQLGVSRMTARQVYLALERDGFLARSDRSGWYVAYSKLQYQLARSASFVTNIERVGEVANIVVKEKGIIPSSGLVKDALQIPDKVDVFFVRRLFCVVDRPAMVESLFVLASRFPLLLDAKLDQSILALWETNYGVTLKSSKAKIRLLSLSDTDAQLLAVGPGSLGVNLSQVFLDEVGNPIGLSQQHWRGDIAEISFSIDYRQT
jgi:GntR family transcriptional regulator